MPPISPVPGKSGVDKRQKSAKIGFDIAISEEGKKTEIVRPKRAGMWCEPAGTLCCTGPGAFRLNRAGRVRAVTAPSFQDTERRQGDRRRDQGGTAFFLTSLTAQAVGDVFLQRNKQNSDMVRRSEHELRFCGH